MEYAPHGTLHDFFAKYEQALDEKLARTYFHQLIAGLEYLHDNNVAHMDIKLDNIAIGYHYQMKFIDFDLSLNLTDNFLMSKGTQDYRARELLKGKRPANLKACDIYSLGIVLFCMIF